MHYKCTVLYLKLTRILHCASEAIFTSSSRTLFANCIYVQLGVQQGKEAEAAGGMPASPLHPHLNPALHSCCTSVNILQQLRLRTIGEYHLCANIYILNRILFTNLHPIVKYTHAENLL